MYQGGEEWKMAFNTCDRHLEHLVMTFRPCKAPAVFQHFVNEVFHYFLNHSILVYLYKFGKVEKRCFKRSELLFLDYIVSNQD